MMSVASIYETDTRSLFVTGIFFIKSSTILSNFKSTNIFKSSFIRIPPSLELYDQDQSSTP